MSFEPIICAEGLGKSYRMYKRPSDRLWQFIFGRQKKLFNDFVALQDVSINLMRGQVLGIVGVNGAGKSTLLQLIAGTLSPTSGKIQAHGRVAALLELGSGFNTDFTGRENIYLNAAVLGLTRSEIQDRIQDIIEFASIGIHIDQPVKTYSSGMVIRLAFSIATSVDADILIIDEALSVGDGAFRRRSFDRIMQIKDKGVTILFCSHVLYHVETFCDQAIWLHRGKVQKIGTPAEVLRPYEEFIDVYEKNVDAVPLALCDAPTQPVSESGNYVISPATRQTGEARIITVKVVLDGNTGTELHGQSKVSHLEVQIEFESDPQMPAPSAALVFSSESGKILASSLSHTQSAVFRRTSSGKGVARITIERIFLNKGRYRVGVYLFCENGIHGYAMVDPVAHLNFSHAGLEVGAFLLDGNWVNEHSDSEKTPR